MQRHEVILEYACLARERAEELHRNSPELAKLYLYFLYAWSVLRPTESKSDVVESNRSGVERVNIFGETNSNINVFIRTNNLFYREIVDLFKHEPVNSKVDGIEQLVDRAEIVGENIREDSDAEKERPYLTSYVKAFGDFDIPLRAIDKRHYDDLVKLRYELNTKKLAEIEIPDEKILDTTFDAIVSGDNMANRRFTKIKNRVQSKAEMEDRARDELSEFMEAMFHVPENESGKPKISLVGEKVVGA